MNIVIPEHTGPQKYTFETTDSLITISNGNRGDEIMLTINSIGEILIDTTVQYAGLLSRSLVLNQSGKCKYHLKFEQSWIITPIQEQEGGSTPTPGGVTYIICPHNEGFAPIMDLPQVGQEGVIYFCKNEKGHSHNQYRKYMWINGDWEDMGIVYLKSDFEYKTSKIKTDYGTYLIGDIDHFSTTRTSVIPAITEAVHDGKREYDE